MTGARPRTARTRGSHATSPRHPPQEVRDENGIPYIVGSSSPPWFPPKMLIMKIFFTARIASAFWSIISDCDETFNYWEPLHFFLNGKGFQTWEYSPEFALRSYLYVLVYTLPAWIYQNLLSPYPMYVFFFLRCVMAMVCTVCETYFILGIHKAVGTNVARITLVFLVFSCGMFISSAAFLPSSTSMYLTMLSYGAWFRNENKLAIFFTALSTFLSWPFVAVIGAPIALDVLRKSKITFFIQWCLISTTTILLPQIYIDSQFYGKSVIAPWNIVKYNVFTSHGPDLYGTEPWSFYIVNGILNFNLAFILALAAYPMLSISHLVLPSSRNSSNDVPKWLMLLGMYLWLGIFIIQPHKEERFLFPIYPLLAFAAALTLDNLQKVIFRMFANKKNRHYLEYTNWISILAVIVFSILSASRILAVYLNYNAPINIWMYLSHIPHMQPDKYNEKTEINVCMGKEWYRYQSSFFLPNSNWNMKYLRSEFKGQLPQPYLDDEEATQIIRNTFNDQNKEETNRYNIAIEECHFIVDLDTDKETPLEPQYSKNTNQWQIEHSYPFLIANESNKFFRAFYVPFVSPKYCKYGNYVVLKNKNPKTNSKRKRHSNY